MRGNGSNVFKNWQIKFTCLLLAVAVYFLAIYAIQDKREITVPLQVTLPSEYHATSIIPDSVTVVIKGTEDRIYMVDITKLVAEADFSNVEREGVSSVPVILNTSVYEDVMSLENITIYTQPASVKVYFEK